MKRPVSGALRVVVVAVVALATACSVGLDDEPRAIEQLDSTTTTEVSAAEGTVDSTLYFVREGVLMPMAQEVSDGSIASKITALAQPVQRLTQRYGLTTSIPAGTSVLSVEQDGANVTVNLSAEFDNVVGLSRQQAIGQMVLTVTAQPGVRSLSFQVDGRPLSVASPVRGDRTEVRACDYAVLLATPDQALDAGLPAATIVQLEARYEVLNRCDSGS